MRTKSLVWIVRPGASGAEVLLLQRPARRGGGDHPVTGKCDPGETPEECAAREAFEETGLRGKLVDLDYAHRYRGKRDDVEEHAFLLRVATGAEPTLSDEHDAHRWATASEARSAITWPAHAQALDRALKAF